MGQTTVRSDESELRFSSPLAEGMISLLDSFASYPDGWDSYRAPAPGSLAIENAKALVVAAFECEFPCDRVEPSAMGGVGATFESRGRCVVIEFYNRGTAHALFADTSDLEEMITRPVPTTAEGYRNLLADARQYLDG